MNLTTEEAKRAVTSIKFLPNGKRSLTAALPHFDFQRISTRDMIDQLDNAGSMVFVLVETRECLENINAIASLGGVKVLLVGANDLSLELGVLGEFEHRTFQTTLE